MSLGDIYTTSTPDSAAKKNLLGVISGTGDYLAALDKTKITLVACTSTGSGLTADHVYLVSADNTSFIDLSVLGEHVHTSSTTGGDLVSIHYNNADLVDLLLMHGGDFLSTSWIETVTGTGTVEYNTTDGTTGEKYIRLRPNGTSASGSTITYPTLLLDWTGPSMFISKVKIETATSIALHTGVQADHVTAADSNTQKYNAEVCTATNNNWWLRSANGSANSTSDTGVAITTNKVGLRLVHLPNAGTPEVNIAIDGDDFFQKTTHIPTTSASDNKLIVNSVKNSTAADRPLRFYGCRLTYYNADKWGYGYP